ncbi:hypothetical protein DPMN_101985 [Dreissena polymorpha]|uniref:Uncharacterized protein n=1 Tax=Dreissena polymorpha TaxID=45954 RepID=A0A9D4LIN4_DREPO|nr:hypothetical protein DPMN_101985 [Dreissena polymorpha]
MWTKSVWIVSGRVNSTVHDLVNAEPFPYVVYKCVVEEKYWIKGGCCQTSKLSTDPNVGTTVVKFKVELRQGSRNRNFVCPTSGHDRCDNRFLHQSTCATYISCQRTDRCFPVSEWSRGNQSVTVSKESR